MKILMLESVCTKDGAFNVDEVHTVDKDVAKEWIKLGYAIKVGGRESASKDPATRTATKRKARKR